MADAAVRLGATFLTGCAVRAIETSAGRVCGVVTERGAIRCDSVVLAGGAWSRLFLGNCGIDFPQLKVLGSVMRTAPMEGLPELAVGAGDFSFRRRLDGGYTVARRGANITPIVPDSFRLFVDFLPAYRKTWRDLRLRVGRSFIEGLRMPRRWQADEITPFEKIRVLDPEPDAGVLKEARRNLARAFPAFAQMTEVERWGGLIDVTPDAVPTISTIDDLPGLVLATGFSGHGFGLGPGAGRLAAELATGADPVVDPSPFKLSRFSRSALCPAVLKSQQ
jgi:glycine/D-amino acid oxidase-like deaminating enzyme